MHLFPAQANGYPGIDFGNQCWAAEPYPGPGYRGQNKPANNRLRKCPNLQRDLHACRQQNTGIARKTILLSVGGGSTAYQLTGAADGDALAKQLWYMFGPRQNSWVKQGLPRGDKVQQERARLPRPACIRGRRRASGLRSFRQTRHGPS